MGALPESEPGQKSKTLVPEVNAPATWLNEIIKDKSREASQLLTELYKTKPAWKKAEPYFIKNRSWLKRWKTNFPSLAEDFSEFAIYEPEAIELVRWKSQPKKPRGVQFRLTFYFFKEDSFENLYIEFAISNNQTAEVRSRSEEISGPATYYPILNHAKDGKIGQMRHWNLLIEILSKLVELKKETSEV